MVVRRRIPYRTTTHSWYLRSLGFAVLFHCSIRAGAKVLRAEQVDAYQRDGYLFLQGLLSTEQIDALAAVVQDVARSNSPLSSPGTYFSLLQSGGIFLPSPNGSTRHIYRDVALHSVLPLAVAELMQLDAERGDNLRLLRDITMVKDVNEMKTCDWHVDDVGFWPISYHDDQGINVWIALDDMPYGGNMALAPQSQVAPWRDLAYHTIGQNRSRPHGLTKAETRASIQEEAPRRYLTCDMHLVNATLRDQIEKTAVYLDSIRKGDIIFASRLLFHRTMTVSPEGLAYYAHTDPPITHLHRYSLRYEPGTAAINAGFNVEWSVLHDPANAGRTLNAIAELYPDWTFYPQVWPVPEDGAGIQRVAAGAAEWTARAKQEIYETLLFSTSATSTDTDSEVVLEEGGETVIASSG